MKPLWIAATLASMACGGTSTTAPTAPVSGSTSTPSATSLWVSEGVRLTNADAGFSGVLADTTTLPLNDGRWRMFLFTGGQYRSAISPDGLSFAMEPGTRLPVGAGHARALRLDDRRVRMYFISGSGISSAISGDEGTTFTFEAGERVSGGSFGASALSGCSIVRARDGRWRMYFSDLPIPGAPIGGTMRIFSASSSDLMSWSPDPGVRVGQGAALGGPGEHPAAFANADGSVSLFYFRNSTLDLLTSTSTDGLTFTAESSVGISSANDPDVIRLPDGSLRMYYNWGNNGGGTISSARR